MSNYSIKKNNESSIPYEVMLKATIGLGERDYIIIACFLLEMDAKSYLRWVESKGELR